MLFEVLRSISIHALREEGDGRQGKRANVVGDFYPRPPRGGRPFSATVTTAFANFYPRPPRGGRLTTLNYPRIIEKFLSTPSARRATRLRSSSALYFANFYPRPPRGGRPEAQDYPTDTDCISIHALREEGDPIWARTWTTPRNFYPRPPRGGRLITHLLKCFACLFLSTPSARRATQWKGCTHSVQRISIHALREEGD